MRDKLKFINFRRSVKAKAWSQIKIERNTGKNFFPLSPSAVLYCTSTSIKLFFFVYCVSKLALCSNLDISLRSMHYKFNYSLNLLH